MARLVEMSYAGAMISLDELAQAIRAARRLRRLGLDTSPDDGPEPDDRKNAPQHDHRDPPAAIS